LLLLLLLLLLNFVCNLLFDVWLFGFDLIYLFIYVYFVFICSLARGFKRKRCFGNETHIL